MEIFIFRLNIHTEDPPSLPVYPPTYPHTVQKKHRKFCQLYGTETIQFSGDFQILDPAEQIQNPERKGCCVDCSTNVYNAYTLFYCCNLPFESIMERDEHSAAVHMHCFLGACFCRSPGFGRCQPGRLPASRSIEEELFCSFIN